MKRNSIFRVKKNQANSLKDKSYVVISLVLATAISALTPKIALTQTDSITLGEASNYAIFGLKDGTVIINSATQVNGNIGYGENVESLTNQKIGENNDWSGTAYIHSSSNFNYTDKNFIPSNGIIDDGSFDNELQQANSDAIASSAQIAGLAPNHVLGALGDDDNLILNSKGNLNVISLTSLSYNYDTLELVGDSDDYFIFNITGDFDCSGCEIELTGVSPEHVLFNFPNQSTININKSDTIFRGTILAPSSDVLYHNPAVFEGAIVAKNINVHSDFNLTYMGFEPLSSQTPPSIKTSPSIIYAD
ncbi:Protein of unknown function (DUF3494) [Xenococcus sp. PCC 7305]|uniref:collagen-binding domain-containing protein n=1 Tax=Xenococcus sp. PCC 7305 TaxID=102125 RepID=UPI0002AC2CDF|nr:collagen-binding domain-containing protein [Xenococcus sp. PCC 7305]ELS00585.1 Protein of unknown function (DUF3494) [Xenococcus sp. PCC 7305]